MKWRLTMPDVLGHEIPPALESWLDRMRGAIVACESDYSPPGAKGGQPHEGRQPVGLSREVRFVFTSDTKDPAREWKATLIIPPGARAGTELELSVVDAAGKPVAGGMFRLAGCSIPVKDGKGSLPLEVFVSGLRNVDVSLTRQSCPAESGVLSFFCGEEA